jgi:protein-disulfide isomerase
MVNRKKKWIRVVMIVTGLLIVMGFGVFTVMSSFAGNGSHTPTVYSIPYQGQPSIGNADAPVQLVEFGDFKCRHCKEFHDQIFPRLLKDFIHTGKVQMHFIHYAFIGDSKISAAASKSISQQNQAAFWKFYDAIYSNQQQKKQATPEFLVKLIQKYIPEVNAYQVSKDLKNKTYEPMVLADNQIAQSLQIDEVPKVFVNGKVVKDSLDYAVLKKIIEDELKVKKL